MNRDAIKIGDVYKEYWNSTGTYYSLTEYQGNIIGNQDDDIMIYNTFKKTFEHYDFTNTSYLYSSSDTLYLGTSDGKVYSWGNGSTYMSWSWKTKIMTFGREDKYKRPVQLTIIHDQTSATSNVTVKGYFDDGVAKTIGTMDLSEGTYHNFFISDPLFKKFQLELSGSTEANIQEIDFTCKIRGVGYV